MANGKGNGNSNGWRQQNRDCGGDGWRQPQRQWPTATAMAMGNCDGDGDVDGNGVGDGNGDGNGNGNGNSHGEGDHYKGRVASSCGGNVQCFWRGDTLPPPPWTQRKVHSPADFEPSNEEDEYSRLQNPTKTPIISKDFLRALPFCPIIHWASQMKNNPKLCFCLCSISSQPWRGKIISFWWRSWMQGNCHDPSRTIETFENCSWFYS